MGNGTPNVNKTFSLVVIDSWDPDFSQDNCAVRGRRAANLHEVVLDGEVDKLRVAQSYDARPQLWFMLVPVVARLDDFGLDLVHYDVESLHGFGGWRVGCVEVDALGERLVPESDEELFDEGVPQEVGV